MSPKTGHKWLHQFEAAGPAGLQDRSRRPKSNSRAISLAMADRLVELRCEERVNDHLCQGGSTLHGRPARNPHCDQSEYPFPCSRPVAPAAGDDILPWQDKSASGRAVRSSTFVEVGYREPANRAGATDAKRR